MDEKKSYEIDLEDIVLRRARSTDNMEEIAMLIYQTDPYIYPYWFNDDIDEAIDYLVPRIQKPGYIYYYENCYVAYEAEQNRIVGLICAIDQTTDLEYDYTDDELINSRYNFTIKNYFKEIIHEVQENKYMYILNVCIDGRYRSNKIGSRLLRYFIEQMHEAGFDDIELDCLMHNLRAKNLFHSLGFIEVAEGIGFDGTENSTVEVVFFKKKSTPYTAKDFQQLPSYDVKANDEERERLIFNNICKKKGIELQDE